MASDEEGLQDIEKEVNDIKGKKKMFKFSGQILGFSDFLKHKPEKPQNGTEFKLKFSNFQAFQVPLVKEKNLLQKSNGELRKQNADLKELCTVLEAELKELQNVFSDMLKEVEALEAKFSSIIELDLKEKAMNSELEAFLLKSEGHKEKLSLEESLLNQLHSETTIEVENPQRTASEDALGIDRLCMDKTWFEAALEEVQGKVKLYESKLEIHQMESETKVLRFICELSASKQKQKIPIADFEKVQKMLEDAKANEEKLDIILIRLELRLKASEYERQKLAEEVSCLKVQLQSSEVLQDEVFALRRSFCAEKTKRQKLKASFSTLSGDYEELKAKRVSDIQRISDMEKAMSELLQAQQSRP